MNVYVELTRRLNEGRLRAVLAGGQAVVMHRLAIMSKDGDWILREDEQSLSHVLAVYVESASVWAAAWPKVAASTEGWDLPRAHAELVRKAGEVLPTTVPGGPA
jgi:hypothetical protein